jgi:O-methyltransferase
MLSLITDDLLDRMVGMALSSPPGAFAEVGVYQGGSAFRLYEIAQHQGRELYLYDSFAGMPIAGEIDAHRLGDYADCSVEKIAQAMPKAHIQMGIFPDTVVRMPRMAFVHADADQYESTKAICRVFEPLMVKGGVILFDDYRGVAGCIKAVDEYFPERLVIPDGRAIVRF